jgi:hypothetical protein
MGAILTVVNGNKKNQTMQVAINNLNYAVDSMTRSMKTGYGYSTVTGSLGCDSEISLTTTDDVDITYSRQQQANGNGGLYINSGGGAYEGYLTAPDLDITKLCFDLVDLPETQPSVSIVIQGRTNSGKASLQTSFNLYTSVTQRQVQYD